MLYAQPLKLLLEGWLPGDQDGKPDRAAIEIAQGYLLLRTDQNGWIELTTNGEQM